MGGWNSFHAPHRNAQTQRACAGNSFHAAHSRNSFHAAHSRNSFHAVHSRNSFHAAHSRSISVETRMARTKTTGGDGYLEAHAGQWQCPRVRRGGGNGRSMLPTPERGHAGLLAASGEGCAGIRSTQRAAAAKLCKVAPGAPRHARGLRNPFYGACGGACGGLQGPWGRVERRPEAGTNVGVLGEFGNAFGKSIRGFQDLFLSGVKKSMNVSRCYFPIVGVSRRGFLCSGNGAATTPTATNVFCNTVATGCGRAARKAGPGGAPWPAESPTAGNTWTMRHPEPFVTCVHGRNSVWRYLRRKASRSPRVSPPRAAGAEAPAARAVARGTLGRGRARPGVHSANGRLPRAAPFAETELGAVALPAWDEFRGMRSVGRIPGNAQRGNELRAAVCARIPMRCVERVPHERGTSLHNPPPPFPHVTIPSYCRRGAVFPNTKSPCAH